MSRTAMQLLKTGEHRVRVDYDMPQSKRELRRVFMSLGEWGHPPSYGFNLAWAIHPSCSGIDQTPGDRIILVKNFGRSIHDHEAIAEMGKHGYRPAIHHEGYAFARYYPELYDFSPDTIGGIVVPGSFTIVGGRMYCMFMHGSSTRRNQRLISAKRFGGDSHHESTWFLFVRKDKRKAA